jgi:hypothetical protein
MISGTLLEDHLPPTPQASDTPIRVIAWGGNLTSLMLGAPEETLVSPWREFCAMSQEHVMCRNDWGAARLARSIEKL